MSVLNQATVLSRTHTVISIFKNVRFSGKGHQSLIIYVCTVHTHNIDFVTVYIKLSYTCAYSSIWKLMLGDHCATPPGLRLSYDGYLTADINLDMPPMRCLLIDPYTG